MLSQASTLISKICGENTIAPELLHQPFIVQKAFTLRVSQGLFRPGFSNESGALLEDAQIEELRTNLDILESLKGSRLEGNIRKSLFWFYEAENDKSLTTRFLKLFISIETLCKEKPVERISKCEDGSEKKIKETVPILDSISKHLNLVHNIDDVKTRFHLSRIARLRGLIAHHGRDLKISFHINDLLRTIYIDVLNRITEFPSTTLSARYLENEGLYAYLRKIAK
jgi:hypothetical protein